VKKPVLSASDAVAKIQNGKTIGIGGSGAGHAIPEALLKALGERFAQTGKPDSITLLHAFGVGDQGSRGLEHMAHPAMYKRVVGGHWSMQPTMAKLAAENQFEAYCLPGGVVTQLFHTAAAGSPGWMTHVGLDTFIDPRLEGGKLNQKAQEDIVELVERDGKEWLFYPTIPIDVALIKAWTADPYGNLGMRKEAGYWHNCPLAQAAKTSDGITIAVVRELTEAGGIHPQDVIVPGCFVDYIVVDPTHGMTYQIDFDPTLNGDATKPESEFGAFPLTVRKVIARRAALELAPEAVLNVGFGMPDGVVKVAREQGIADTILTTIEHGQFGGIPAEGLDFGASYNAQAIVETTHMFDFYQGRGVDQTYLGFLQIDRHGNVNVSKLGDTIVGTGGFIDIHQRARKVTFCGTLAVRAKSELTDSGLCFTQLGKPKLVEDVLQVTFSARYALEHGQEVLYVTEAAVFRLTEYGIVLEEIAPGVDLEKELIPQMGFRPLVSDSLKTMPAEIFQEPLLPLSLFRHYS
jgi:propionate CoA-transferase